MNSLRFLSITFLLVVLASCGGGGGGGPAPLPPDGNGTPTPPPPPPNDYTWTVMYYMAADNNLALSSIFMSGQLIDLNNYPEDIAVVAQGEFWDTELYELQGFDPELDEAVEELETKVSRGRLTNNNEPGPHDQEFSREGFNSASPQALTDFLTWAKTNFRADHYMLVLLGHGSSWRTHRSVSGILTDESAGGIPMTTKQVAQAITAAGMRVDVLDLTSCVMGNIEVALDFKSVADYLVFSQTYMSVGPGREYQAVVQNYINTHSDVSPQSLVTYMVTSYKDFYQTGGFPEAATRSAVDLSKVDSVVDALGNVASTAAADSGLTPSELRAATSSSQPFYQGLNVDLLDVLNEIEPLAGSSTRTAASEARDALNDFIMTSMFKAGESPKGEGAALTRASGVSIFFPDRMNYADDILNEYEQLEFQNSTSWRNVVEKAYEGDSPIPFVPGGFTFVLAWDSNVDIDLYVAEAAREDVSEEDLSVASPWLGSTAQDGYLSMDSSVSGYSYETYAAYPRVHDGYYLVIADYFADGWGVIGWHWHADVTLIVLDQNDTEIWRSDPIYMDEETPYDPYAEEYGVHAFGGLRWDGSEWVFDTPDKLPARAKSVAGLERPRVKPGLPLCVPEASASH